MTNPSTERTPRNYRRYIAGGIGVLALIPTIILGAKSRSDHQEAQPHTVVQHESFSANIGSKVCGHTVDKKPQCYNLAGQVNDVQATKTTHYAYNPELDVQASNEGDIALAGVVVTVLAASIALTGSKPTPTQVAAQS